MAFNDSQFALLPGGEAFVKSQVSVSGLGGVGVELLEGGGSWDGGSYHWLGKTSRCGEK